MDHPPTKALSPGSSRPTTPISHIRGPGPSLCQSSDYQCPGNPRPCYCGSIRYGSCRLMKGAWEAGMGAMTTIVSHHCCPLPSFICSHPTGQRKEAGVPGLPPTAPGSTHMAEGHGLCPAHETHLTQNLFQLLQSSLAAVEASLSDASASHTPPKEGEGAHTNNGALWHPPQRPPGPTRAKTGTMSAGPGKQGPRCETALPPSPWAGPRGPRRVV